MADREIIIREKLTHEGIFDFSALYSYAHAWFQEEQYNGVDEERYSEKVSGNKRNLLIDWIATKNYSEYFKIELKINFKISNLTDVEVEIDNQKKKMNKGSIEINVKGTLIKDPDSKWESSPFTRFTREIYNKFIIPARVLNVKNKVSDHSQRFKDDIKALLELSGRRYRE